MKETFGFRESKDVVFKYCVDILFILDLHGFTLQAKSWRNFETRKFTLKANDGVSDAEVLPVSNRKLFSYCPVQGEIQCCLQVTCSLTYSCRSYAQIQASYLPFIPLTRA